MRIFLIVALVFLFSFSHEIYGKHQKIDRYSYRAVMKLKRKNLEKMVTLQKEDIAETIQKICKEKIEKIELKLLVQEGFYLPYYDVLTKHCHLRINGWDGTLFLKEQR